MSDPQAVRQQLEEGGTSYETESDGSAAFQWLRMAVTTADPKHVWHAGKGYPGDAFDGFTAHTDDHVWVQARGGGSSPDNGGTLTIQSEGQSWLQSMSGPTSFVAASNVVFGTGTEAKSGFKLAADGGVVVIADSRIQAGTVPVGSPENDLSAETQAATTAGNWGTWWTTVDTAAALGLNAMDRAMAAVLSGSAMPSGKMDKLMTTIGQCANFAGAGANLYSMIGGAAGASTPPGMTFAGEAGVLMGSERTVNVWGVPGALLGSAFACVFGGIATGAIAGVDAGMSAIGPVDMGALIQASVSAVSLRSAVGIEVASRKGSLKAEAPKGVSANGGSVEARATVNLDLTSMGWVNIVAKKGAVSFKSNATLGVSATVGMSMGLLESGVEPGVGITEVITDEAPNDVPVATPPEPGAEQPQIAMTAAGGVKILSGAEASAPVLKITAESVQIQVGSSGPTATVDMESAELAMGDSTVKASAESLKLDGQEVSFS